MKAVRARLGLPALPESEPDEEKDFIFCLPDSSPSLSSGSRIPLASSSLSQASSNIDSSFDSAVSLAFSDKSVLSVEEVSTQGCQTLVLMHEDVPVNLVGSRISATEKEVVWLRCCCGCCC